MENEISVLVEEIWETENMPVNWRESLISPVHRKEKKTMCANYRPIALLDVVYKLVAAAIKDRLEEEAESILGEHQSGFRKNRSVMDKIFTIKQIRDNSLEQNMSLHVVFVDIKQAYDLVYIEELYKIMEELKILIKIIPMVRMTLNNRESIVLIKSKASGKFTVKRGLRHVYLIWY